MQHKKRGEGRGEREEERVQRRGREGGEERRGSRPVLRRKSRPVQYCAAKAAFKRIKSGAQKKSGVQEKKQRSRGAKPSLKREWKRRGRSPLPRERARKRSPALGILAGAGDFLSGWNHDTLVMFHRWGPVRLTS